MKHKCSVIYIDKSKLDHNKRAEEHELPCIAFRRGARRTDAPMQAGRGTSIEILDADGDVVARVLSCFDRRQLPKILQGAPVNVWIESEHGVRVADEIIQTDNELG